LPEKHGSWSVRHAWLGLVPKQAHAPATTGALWKNEEGNVVSVRNKTHARDAETPKKRSLRSRTRPSLGPETRARHSCSSLLPSARKRRDGGLEQAVQLGIGVGQTCASRRNRHTGPGTIVTTHCAARRASPLLGLRSRSSRRSCVTRKKRKVVMATVPARK